VGDILVDCKNETTGVLDIKMFKSKCEETLRVANGGKRPQKSPIQQPAGINAGRNSGWNVISVGRKNWTVLKRSPGRKAARVMYPPTPVSDRLQVLEPDKFIHAHSIDAMSSPMDYNADPARGTHNNKRKGELESLGQSFPSLFDDLCYDDDECVVSTEGGKELDLLKVPFKSAFRGERGGGRRRGEEAGRNTWSGRHGGRGGGGGTSTQKEKGRKKVEVANSEGVRRNSLTCIVMLTTV